MTIVAMPTLMCFGWLLSLNLLALLNLASRCVVYASLQCRSLHFPSIHFFAFAVAPTCFSHLLLVPIFVLIGGNNFPQNLQTLLRILKQIDRFLQYDR